MTPASELDKKLLFLGFILPHFQNSYFILGQNLLFVGTLRLNNGREISSKQHVLINMFISSDIPFHMPTVYAYAPWLKTGANWHRFEDAKICWEHPYRWENSFEKIGINSNNIKTVFSVSAKWCINSVISLLYRHWYAHCHNITSWPSEWDFWPHTTVNDKEEFDKNKNTKNNIFCPPH